jgi:tRNA (cytosine38-C5)-methyltransferase
MLSFLEEVTSVEDYLVPSEIVLKEGNRSDIVFSDSTRCCCFTKAYGSSYVLGTGSVIQMAPKDVQGDPEDPRSLLNLKLRYFTPSEICRLHGFNDKMDWAGLSRRQQYALLGNSLNAIVVSELIKYLFSE